MVNNLNLINKLCNWKPGTYYKFACIIRSKDGNSLLQVKENKRELIVKHWLVENQDSFDKLIYDMLTYCRLFNARLYMTTDRKSTKKSLFNISREVLHYLEQVCNGVGSDISPNTMNKIVASVSSVSESTDSELGSKRWLYDVDTKDETVLNKIGRASCRERV